MPTYTTNDLSKGPAERAGLYTPEQRAIRDTSVWTLVQGILAPLQFVVFLVSLGLVIRTLITGVGYEIATVSILIKTLILYIIMVTGAIWEKVVFGKYLFADSFFWEDVVSMLVMALHTAYVAALFSGFLSPVSLLVLALAAYAAYVINAVQFVLKLRAARLQSAANISSENVFTNSDTAEKKANLSQNTPNFLKGTHAA